MTEDLPELRASDADRERVAEVLRDAVAEGRLDDGGVRGAARRDVQGPYVRGVGAAHRAICRRARRRRPGAAVAAQGAAARRRRGPERIVGGTEGSVDVGVAVLGGFQRKGRWTVAAAVHGASPSGAAARSICARRTSPDREVVINCCRDHGRGAGRWCRRASRSRCAGSASWAASTTGEDGVPGEPGAPRVIVTGLRADGRRRRRAQAAAGPRSGASEGASGARLERRSASCAARGGRPGRLSAARVLLTGCGPCRGAGLRRGVQRGSGAGPLAGRAEVHRRVAIARKPLSLGWRWSPES